MLVPVSEANLDVVFYRNTNNLKDLSKYPIFERDIYGEA